MYWNPVSKLPDAPTPMLICIEFPDGSRCVANSKGNFCPMYGKGRVIGWMPLEPILKSPMGYDPTFGDGKLCLCGHPYYRHFDTYEDMAPVGCKYCHAAAPEGVDYRVEIPVPDRVCLGGNYEEWLNKYASVCSGFKWDGA